MKKTLRIMGLCALAVALLATSCKKEERKLTNSFTAELTQPVSDSKTHIGNYNGSSNYLLWNSGDQIKVFNAEGSAYLFSTTNSNVPVATFTSNANLDEEAAYCAFYPAANASGLTGGYIYLTLSENQTYANGTFATGTYPIAASNGGSGTTFTFHSPCGVLAIPFKGSGTIGSIELTGKQNEPLAGQLQINPVGFDPENPSFSLVNPVTTITLTCANGLVLNAETAKTCMFVVPRNVFAQGFTAVVKDLNHNEIYTLETTKDNTIVAEQIMWMPTVNVAALAVTTDEAVVDENSVTLNGHFTTPEGVTVSEAGFYWGVGAMEREVGTVANNNISFTIDMEDLIQGTTYNVYAFAKNGNVETIGNTVTFTIEAPASAPVVVTAPAGHETPDLSVGTAVCYGGIESLDGITEYGICYSTESFSKATVQYVQSDNWANGVFSATLSGLGDGNTVYYRAYAINTAGYGYGEIESFTTPAAPTVTTTEATEITTTTAVCGGNVTADGGMVVTAKGVCYGTSHNPTVADSHTTNGTGTGSFTSNLEGLTPNTTYYVRAYATNGVATSYGDEVEFTTLEEIIITAPTVTTNNVTSITTNSAVVGGQITDAGNGTISESGICYKTGNAEWTCVTLTATNNAFSTTLEGLTPNTTYTVRAYATNEEGTGYGAEVNFTTEEEIIITVPTVTTNAVTDITANSAVVGGQITDAGNGTISESGICYKTGNAEWTCFTLTATNNAFSTTLEGLTPNTTYTVRAYATNEEGTGYGAEVSFTTLNDGGGDEHEYVDLGLPSGLLWATCNVGADTPEGYGDYFSWGETEPKDFYTFSTYTYSDNPTILPSDHDAATANWGEGWRMPTKADFEELYNNTTNSWTQQNGVKGRLFTAANGNSLFLPAAGYRNGSSLDEADSRGHYWSSSLNTGNPYNAWGCYFHSGYCNVSNYLRDYGRSVRPVRSAR